jgi:hypothetical protein
MLQSSSAEVEKMIKPMLTEVAHEILRLNADVTANTSINKVKPARLYVYQKNRQKEENAPTGGHSNKIDAPEAIKKSVADFVKKHSINKFCEQYQFASTVIKKLLMDGRATPAMIERLERVFPSTMNQPRADITAEELVELVASRARLLNIPLKASALAPKIGISEDSAELLLREKPIDVNATSIAMTWAIAD